MKVSSVRLSCGYSRRLQPGIFFALCIRKVPAMTPARRYLPVLATLLLAFLVLSFLPPVAFARAQHPKTLSRRRIVCQVLPLVSGTFRRQDHLISRGLQRLTYGKPSNRPSGQLLRSAILWCCPAWAVAQLCGTPDNSPATVRLGRLERRFLMSAPDIFLLARFPFTHV